MRVAFLYNEPAEDPAGIAEDSDPARSPIVAALRENGHDVVSLACTLDLETVRRQLEHLQPDVVFNRVESLGGSDALPAALMLLLDVLGIPYTGCPTQPFLATSGKLDVKKRLQAAGLPTPEWITTDIEDSTSPAPPFPAKYIVKSEFEHASFAMDDDSVALAVNRAALVTRIRAAETHWQRPYFAERYIDGREFNLAIVGEGPLVLPPAEIDFSAFPAGKPRIVGQRAKFDATSFEYENTPRRFEFPAADIRMIERLTTLAGDCWRLFNLQGYARVDFRCDEWGQPWILEINANPCLSPDSGFAAAFAQAGIAYADGIERILNDALARRRQPPAARESHNAQLITL
jgi:D-alanine-D-alanine ligase